MISITQSDILLPLPFIVYLSGSQLVLKLHSVIIITVKQGIVNFCIIIMYLQIPTHE